MFFTLGLALLFFLPVIESFNRQFGFSLLLLGSLFISSPLFIKKKIEFDWLEIIWLTILIVFTISLLFSWSISRSYTELMRYIAYFLIFVSFRRFENREWLVKNFFISMVIINSFILSFLFLFYLIPFIKLPIPVNGMTLFYPTYRHNRISDILILAIPLTLFLLLHYQNKKRRYLFIVLSFFFLIILILSMGLGAMLSFTFAFIIYILIKSSSRLKFRALSPFSKSLEKISLILGVVTIILVLSGFLYSNFLTNEGNKNIILKGFFKPLKNELRLEFLRQAIIGYQKSPFVGTGLDTFRYVSKMNQANKSNSSWYVHNQYLQIFQETGIFGGLLFSLLVFVLLFQSYKKIKIPDFNRKNDYFDAIFIVLVASGILAFIDYNWQYLSIFLFWWMGIALYNPVDKYQRVNSLVTPFIIIIICLFSFWIILLPDTDISIKKADDYFSKNNYVDAFNTLEPVYRLDRSNTEIIVRLIRISDINKNYDVSHELNKRVIVLNTDISEYYIQNDYFLYLLQAEIALRNNNFEQAFYYLGKPLFLYPIYNLQKDAEDNIKKANVFFLKKEVGNAVNTLQKYIEKARKAILQKKLSQNEIRIIIEYYLLKDKNKIIY